MTVSVNRLFTTTIDFLILLRRVQVCSVCTWYAGHNPHNLLQRGDLLIIDFINNPVQSLFPAPGCKDYAPMTQPKCILYRDVPMIESWPEKIEAAQSLVSYTLDGRAVPRIRYGNEQDDWGAEQHPCHDCRVLRRRTSRSGLRSRKVPRMRRPTTFL